MPCSASLLNICFKRSLKRQRLSLSLPLVSWVGEELRQLRPLEMGVGWAMKEKGSTRLKSSRAPDFSPFHYLCVSTELSCFCFVMGSSCGKLTFWLNRSNSHWALILSLPGFCASPKVTALVRSMTGGVGSVSQKGGCLSLPWINSQRLPHKAMQKSPVLTMQKGLVLTMQKSLDCGQHCWGTKLIFHIHV